VVQIDDVTARAVKIQRVSEALGEGN